MREARFDLRVLALGTLLAAALSVGLATASLYVDGTGARPDVGPTAATLDEAFSTLSGAALGLLVGSGLTAYFARCGSPLATGIFAGFLAYATVLVPVVVLTGPSDVGTGESLGFALVLGAPLGLSLVLGSMIGAGVRARSRLPSGRRRTPQQP